MKYRTPRNYVGTKNPQKQAKEMLDEVLLDLGKKGFVSAEEIGKIWTELLGEKMAALTEIVRFEEEVLTVKVKSSTLYSLLAVHEKPRLLKGLQQKFTIRNIVFRVG